VAAQGEEVARSHRALTLATTAERQARSERVRAMQKDRISDHSQQNVDSQRNGPSAVASSEGKITSILSSPMRIRRSLPPAGLGIDLDDASDQANLQPPELLDDEENESTDGLPPAPMRTYTPQPVGHGLSSPASSSRRKLASIDERYMPFSEMDVRVVESIAASAGVCLHKALLFGDLHRAQRKTTALLDMVQSTASNKGALDIVDDILDSLRKATRAVRVAVYIHDAPARELLCLVANDDLEQTRRSVTCGVAGRAVRNKKTEHVASSGPNDTEMSLSLEKHIRKMQLEAAQVASKQDSGNAIWDTQQGELPLDREEENESDDEVLLEPTGLPIVCIPVMD